MACNSYLSVISKNILSLILLLSLLLTLTHAQCYDRNGNNRNDVDNFTGSKEAYQPCSPQPWQTDGFSMCCRTNMNGPDRCMANGLCNSTDGDWIIWRESCSDPTWKSPSCVNLYVDGKDDQNQDLSGADAPLVQCADGSWCMNPTQTGTPLGSTVSCCTEKEGFFVNNGVVKSWAEELASNTSTHSSASSADGSSTSSTAAAAVSLVGDKPTPSPQGASSSNSVNMTAVIAGAVVGGLVILGLLAVVFALVYSRRRQSRQQQHQQEIQQRQGEQQQSMAMAPWPREKGYYASPSKESYDSEWSTPRAELDVERPELGGGNLYSEMPVQEEVAHELEASRRRSKK